MLTGWPGVEPASALSVMPSSSEASEQTNSSSLPDGVLPSGSDSAASWPGGPSLRGDLRRGSSPSTWLGLGLGLELG